MTRVVYAVGDARFAATRKDDTTWTMDTGAPIRADGVYTLLVGLLEAETTAWTAGALPGKPSATLEFVTDKGAAGRLSFAGTRATWDALPGVVFQLGSPLPPVPQGAAAQ